MGQMLLGSRVSGFSGTLYSTFYGVRSRGRRRSGCRSRLVATGIRMHVATDNMFSIIVNHVKWRSVWSLLFTDLVWFLAVWSPPVIAGSVWSPHLTLSHTNIATYVQLRSAHWV